MAKAAKKRREEEFEWVCIKCAWDALPKAERKACNYDAYRDLWAKVLERVDEQSRLEASLSWRKENSSKIACLNIPREITFVGEAGLALARGDASYRTDEDFHYCTLEFIVKAELLIPYTSCELPTCEFDFEDEDLDEDEREFRREEERDETMVPKFPLVELRRIAAASSAKDLGADESFLLLTHTVVSKRFVPGARLTSAGLIRLNEYHQREELLSALEDLFRAAAIRAVDLGNEGLARRFVEAERYAASDMYDTLWTDVDTTRAKKTIVEAFLKDFNELQRTVAVSQLPAWKTFRADFEKSMRKIGDGH